MMSLVDITLSVNINRTFAKTILGAVFEFKALGKAFSSPKLGDFEEGLNINRFEFFFANLF